MEQMDSGPGQSTASKNMQSVITVMTPLTGEVGIVMSPVSRDLTG